MTRYADTDLLTAREIVTGQKMPRFKSRGIDEETGEIIAKDDWSIQSLERISFEAKCGTRFAMLWPVGMTHPADGLLEVVEHRGGYWLTPDWAHVKHYAGTDMMISSSGRAGHILGRECEVGCDY